MRKDLTREEVIEIIDHNKTYGYLVCNRCKAHLVTRVIELEDGATGLLLQCPMCTYHWTHEAKPVEGTAKPLLRAHLPTLAVVEQIDSVSSTHDA